ncbi:MAG: amidohydrolase family protein [Bacteroidetes bacterium]|nr:amidohydrolase family protein [Bacteroidota bacterium]
MVQDLFKEISRVVHPIDPLTIHMQESEDEILFCKDKSGPLAEFFASAGISTTDFIPFGDVRPLRQILPLIPRANRLQLVHNTYTAEEEITDALKRRPKLSWCLCPSANLFITGDLPPVEALFKNNAHVTIGTDSLASNRKLSVLSELKIISKNFPMVPFASLVRWSTLMVQSFLVLPIALVKIKPE